MRTRSRAGSQEPKPSVAATSAIWTATPQPRRRITRRREKSICGSRLVPGIGWCRGIVGADRASRETRQGHKAANGWPREAVNITYARSDYSRHEEEV